MPNYTRARKGFTLIELLVVVLILGVLVAVALPSYLSSIRTAKANTANTNAKAIATALQSNGVKTGAYAADLTDAAVLADLGGALPLNPCTNDTSYTFTRTSATVGSVQAGVGDCGATATYQIRL